MIFYIFLAIASGFSIIISRMLNAKLSTETTVYQGTFWNYVTGLLGSVLLLFLLKEPFHFSADLPGIRPYLMYFGGALGMITVIINNYVAPRMPAFYMTVVIFVSQLFAGLLLDYLFFSEFSAGKLIGGLLVLIGLVIYTKGNDTSAATSQKES